MVSEAAHWKEEGLKKEVLEESKAKSTIKMIWSDESICQKKLVNVYVESKNSGRGYYTYLENSGNAGKINDFKDSENRGIVDEGYLLWIRKP